MTRCRRNNIKWILQRYGRKWYNEFKWPTAGFNGEALWTMWWFNRPRGKVNYPKNWTRIATFWATTCESTFVWVLNEVPRHEDVWVNGGMAPCIIHLGARWRWLSASHLDRFTLGKQPRVPIKWEALHGSDKSETNIKWK